MVVGAALGIGALAGCGRVIVDETSGGVGGASISTSSSTTTAIVSVSSSSSASGGAGGSIACKKLGAPEILTAEGDPSTIQRRPLLAAMTNSTTVAVAMGLLPVEVSGPVASSIAWSSPPPWGEWPATLAAPSTVSPYGGEDFRIAAAGASFALLYRSDGALPPVSPSGLLFTVDAAPTAAGALVDGTAPTTAHFVARQAATLLFGWSWELPMNSIHFQTRLATSDGAVLSAVGCGTSSLFADGVPSGAGFLVAYSSSRPFLECNPDNGADGPPDRLQIARVDEGKITFGDEITAFSEILGIKVAPRADGGA